MNPSERKARLQEARKQLEVLKKNIDDLESGCPHVDDDYKSAWRRDEPFHDQVCQVCGESR